MGIGGGMVGRPRKSGMRKPNGRLRKNKTEPTNEQLINQRMMRFGLTRNQAASSFGGYMVGAMYCKGQLQREHVDAFLHFVSLAPVTVRGLIVSERVQTSHRPYHFPIGNRYVTLIKSVGINGLRILHAAANDELICSLGMLKHVLRLVDLTTASNDYNNPSEIHVDRK